jgi:hypothetical protein
MLKLAKTSNYSSLTPAVDWLRIFSNILIGPSGLLLEDSYLFPVMVSCLHKGTQKSNKRSMARTIRVQAKEGPKHPQPVGIKKKGRELVPLVVGSYFSHGPSNVVQMQIVKSNNNGSFRTSITRQCNFFFL